MQPATICNVGVGVAILVMSKEVIDVTVENLKQPIFGSNKFKVRILQEEWEESGSGVVVTVIKDNEKLKDVSVTKDPESVNCWTVDYEISEDGEYEFIIIVNDVEASNSPFKRIWYAKPPYGGKVGKGQDWKWSSQNVGSGFVIGCGKEVKASEKWVKVKWENGNQNNYRWGAEGAYDLMLLEVPSVSLSEEDVAANLKEKDEMYRKLLQQTSVLQTMLNKKGLLITM